MKPLRPREDRKAVRISVRVRTDNGWIDATVRNVSSRGMMLHSLQPLCRNQFVEITRGRARVVGRIVWSDDVEFGLQAQDIVDISALLAQSQVGGTIESTDRRAPPRPTRQTRTYVAIERNDRSKLVGYAIEKAAVLIACTSVSVLAVTSALEAAENPIEEVRVALAASPG
jgi:hypothetical protein